MPFLSRARLLATIFALVIVQGLAATTASAQAPVRVGGDIKEPRLLSRPDPQYPAIAKQARVEGQVVIEATIDQNGNVRDVRVLRGNALFNDAALEAVRRWKYERTLINGAPVDVLTTVVVNFTLKEPIEFSSLLEQARTARDAGRFPDAERLLQSALEQVRNEASAQLLSRPAAPGGTAPVRVGGEIKEPQKIKNVAPVYPEDAKNARVEGQVIIEATIGVDGKVKNGRVLRGVPLFNQAALDAVNQWVYSPTTLNGVPVEVVMTVVVNFVLK
jgi:TonB family protein